MSVEAEMESEWLNNICSFGVLGVLGKDTTSRNDFGGIHRLEHFIGAGDVCLIDITPGRD
jgi:hypothetical protein